MKRCLLQRLLVSSGAAFFLLPPFLLLDSSYVLACFEGATADVRARGALPFAAAQHSPKPPPQHAAAMLSDLEEKHL